MGDFNFILILLFSLCREFLRSLPFVCVCMHTDTHTYTYVLFKFISSLIQPGLRQLRGVVFYLVTDTKELRNSTQSSVSRIKGNIC